MRQNYSRVCGSHTLRVKSHSTCGNCTLRVEITPVRVVIILMSVIFTRIRVKISENHNLRGSRILRVEINLVRVEITLVRVLVAF
jgi:hypothetical protein